jgi:hypothetical protein
VSNLDEAFFKEKIFDYPDADIILRSSDSRDFRVLKLFIIKSSPVLDKLIQATSDFPSAAIPASTTSLPVVHMSESAAILHSLLTFVLPVPPILPPSVEETMELLSVAQKYEISHILVHIRGVIALRDPPLICEANALHIYSLAQKYGLRQEVLQAARLTLNSTLVIENLVDVMPGDHLHELLGYHRRLQRSNIDGFRKSDAYRALTLNCAVLAHSYSGIPEWIDDYVFSMASTPSSFDLSEFQSVLARHISAEVKKKKGKWSSSFTRLPEEAIAGLWMALTTFIHANMEEVSKAHVFHVLRDSNSYRPNQLSPSSGEIRPPMIILAFLLRLPYPCPSAWTLATQMSRFSRQTLLTSASTKRYYPPRHSSSGICFRSPNYLTMKKLMDCLLYACRKNQN